MLTWKKKQKKTTKKQICGWFGAYISIAQTVNIPWNEDIKKSKYLYRKLLKFGTPRTIAVLISCNKNVSKNVHGMINSEDPEQVYTVCICLSVRKHRIITVV